MNLTPKSFLTGAHERLRDASQLWTFYAVTVLLAYGFAMFNLTLAGDDWNVLQANYQTDWVISIGRWMDAIIWRLADDGNFATPLTLGVLAAVYSVFAAACCLCLGMKRRESYLIFACVLICFPINAEPFSFKSLHLIFAFAIILATGSGLLIVRGHELLLERQVLKPAALGAGAVTAFVLSAAAYQMLALLAIALVLARLVGMLRGPYESSKLLQSTALLLGFSAIILGIGFLFYMASVWGVSWLTGVPLNTIGPYAIADSFVESGSQLYRGIIHGVVVLRELFFQRQHLFPLLAKLVFLAMTIALIFVIASGSEKSNYFDQPRPPDVWDGIVRALILAGVIVLLFLTPLVLGMLRKNGLYRYNNLVGIAVPYAMAFALLFDMARDARLRLGIAVLTIAMIAIFIFEQNRASITTFLLNRRDLAIASRMLERITADPAFAPFAAKGQVTIVFFGQRLEKRILPRPFSADAFALGAKDDCGVFNCQLIRIEPAFQLISESGMTYHTDIWPYIPEDTSAEEKQSLEQRIKEAHPWPAPDAVIFGTGVIVIMLQSAQ
jgi:hypothetical protein